MEATEKRRYFRPGDLLAILLVFALAAALFGAFFAARRGGAAEIAIDGETVVTLPLDRDTVYPVISGDHHLTVHIEGGEVFVTDADCPDKVCEHTGRISAKGTSIVCAVARVSIRVVKGGESDADHTAG